MGRLPSHAAPKKGRKNTIISRLVLCGRQYAALVKLPPAPDSKMRAKLDEILFKRQQLDAFHIGILTRVETRNLILAHMQTLIASEAGVREPKPLQNQKLFRKIERILERQPCQRV